MIKPEGKFFLSSKFKKGALENNNVHSLLLHCEEKKIDNLIYVPT